MLNLRRLTAMQKDLNEEISRPLTCMYHLLFPRIDSEYRRMSERDGSLELRPNRLAVTLFASIVVADSIRRWFYATMRGQFGQFQWSFYPKLRCSRDALGPGAGRLYFAQYGLLRFAVQCIKKNVETDAT